MKKFRAVLDTNVLYAGLYSSAGASFQLLRKVDQGALVPILSTTLLFEYEDLLKRQKDFLNLTDRQIDAILDALCRVGEAQKVHFLWRPQLHDAKDDHILELSVAAGGAPVITHNLKDFTAVGKFGISVQTPAMMLRRFK